MNKGLRKYYLLIIGVCFAAFFVGNGAIPADIMEARNLATAREMVETGNWLVPTMNGELRVEKPPLPTWIAAAVELAFPFSLPAQRAAAGVAATFMAIFLFLLVRRLTGEETVALIAALVLATCYSVIMMGRTATWDIYCHSFMLGAIYLTVCAFGSPGRQWGRFAGAGLMMGLSFLSKGPVSFYALLLPFLIAYIFSVRPSVRGKAWPVAAMAAVCLAVSFWWPAYIAVFHPETGIEVAAGEAGNWLNYNVRPLWYYWQFPAEAGIWALFWVTSLFYFFFRRPTGHRTAFRVSVLWTIAAFVLLSLIPEKKTRYLLPMLIPGAVNVAFYIWHSARDMTRRADRLIFRINGVLAALIALAVPAAMFLLAKRGADFGVPALVASSLFFAGIAAYILAALYGKRVIRALRVFAGVAALMVGFMIFCYKPAARSKINGERHSIAALRGDERVAGMKFFMPAGNIIRMELVYEAGRNIRPMDMADDSLMRSSLPFVLVAGEPAAPLIDSLAAAGIASEYLGTFDNNWQHPGSRRHNRNLVKSAYLLREAGTENDSY